MNSYLKNIPQELIFTILFYLNVTDRSSLSRANRHFASMCYLYLSTNRPDLDAKVKSLQAQIKQFKDELHELEMLSKELTKGTLSEEDSYLITNSETEISYLQRLKLQDYYIEMLREESVETRGFYLAIALGNLFLINYYWNKGLNISWQLTKIDGNIGHCERYNPYRFAVEFNQKLALEMLVDRGINLKLFQNNISNILTIACKNDYLNIVKCLFSLPKEKLQLDYKNIFFASEEIPNFQNLALSEIASKCTPFIISIKYKANFVFNYFFRFIEQDLLGNKNYWLNLTFLASIAFGNEALFKEFYSDEKMKIFEPISTNAYLNFYRDKITNKEVKTGYKYYYFEEYLAEASFPIQKQLIDYALKNFTDFDLDKLFKWATVDGENIERLRSELKKVVDEYFYWKLKAISYINNEKEENKEIVKEKEELTLRFFREFVLFNSIVDYKRNDLTENFKLYFRSDQKILNLFLKNKFYHCIEKDPNATLGKIVDFYSKQFIGYISEELLAAKHKIDINILTKILKFCYESVAPHYWVGDLPEDIQRNLWMFNGLLRDHPNNSPLKEVITTAVSIICSNKENYFFHALVNEVFIFNQESKLLEIIMNEVFSNHNEMYLYLYALLYNSTNMIRAYHNSLHRIKNLITDKDKDQYTLNKLKELIAPNTVKSPFIHAQEPFIRTKIGALESSLNQHHTNESEKDLPNNPVTNAAPVITECKKDAENKIQKQTYYTKYCLKIIADKRNKFVSEYQAQLTSIAGKNKDKVGLQNFVTSLLKELASYVKSETSAELLNVIDNGTKKGTAFFNDNDIRIVLSPILNKLTKELDVIDNLQIKLSDQYGAIIYNKKTEEMVYACEDNFNYTPFVFVHHH